jgi:TetR/AcrR family transcriptional regulator, transcriptional repressor for nem operon
VSDTARKLMDLAEERMRVAGYHGFSFRELATKAGITSASVHHHFPTKAGMVVAIMQRFMDRFAGLVTPTPGETVEDVILSYRTAFRSGLCDDGGMCLFGMLGAESGGLPPEVAGKIEQFFHDAIADLTRRIGGPDAEMRAFAILATLEGGLILARAYRSAEAFDRATADLVASAANDDRPTRQARLTRAAVRG